MFIIVGHDKQMQQVMVHDTSDHTTMPASYGILEKAIRRGYEIKGLDEQGNIICNNSDVFDELKIHLKPLIAKAILLQLDKTKILELIFPVCKKYGIVDKPFDLEVNTEVCTIVFYLLGVTWHYKEENRERFHSITHIKDFELLPIETRYMLQELYKIPLRPNHSKLIITEIAITKSNSYYIKFKHGLCLHVIIKAYELYYPAVLAAIDTISTAVLKHYIRRLGEERPWGPYFISQLEIQTHYTLALKEIIYAR